MDIDFAIKIVAIIALLSVVALTIYVLFSLRTAKKILNDASNAMLNLTDEVSKSMKIITNDINDLKEQAIVSLKNFDDLSGQIQITTQKLEDEIGSITSFLRPFANLLGDLYYKIAPPINKAANYISATSKAINTFYSFFLKK